jgi:hypothetical protein
MGPNLQLKVKHENHEAAAHSQQASRRFPAAGAGLQGSNFRRNFTKILRISVVVKRKFQNFIIY